jgi:hypothetical protein
MLPDAVATDVTAGYILIQIMPENAGTVAVTLSQMPEIERVDFVTGPYDVIVEARSCDLDTLRIRINAIPEVHRALVCGVNDGSR